MKRLDERTSLHEHLPAIRVYQDDLVKLFGILEDAGLQITISDSEYIYDDLEELKKEKGAVISSLKISGIDQANPGIAAISLKFGSENVSLSSIDLRFESHWYRIRNFIKERHRWYHNALDPMNAILTILIAGMCMFFATALYFVATGQPLTVKSFDEGLSPASNRVKYIAYAVFFLYFVSSLFFSRLYPMIHLDRLHEHQNLWQRGKFWLGGVTGYVCTKTIDWFFGW